MQGKEVSEQEAANCTAGIDVSKSWLDAHVVPEGVSLRVANTSEGIRQLKRWLIRHKTRLVAVEATGKWHREICRSVHASAIAVAVTNPYRVRHFAKAAGVLDKTDRIDARVLAMFATAMAPAVRAPAPKALEELKELVTARQTAVAELTMLENQLCVAESSFLKRQLKERIARLKIDIKAIERECLKRIKADEAMAGRYAILISIPGIGPVIAVTLIANLAELGSLTGKQIGKLAGLAPVADDSGERRGARVVWGGRAVVRRMLYLAAVSAIRCDADMKAFYSRLMTNNDSAKRALIAVARKMILLANTLLAENRSWQPKAPNHA